ncbi:MAG: 7TM diverse intracellular signaling domain-containing protein, partial [Syntrophomonadaceae bacterium]|nr:7TM diverse intracellular signaling domain-containing protein [Syntrophomonadaceae bacterium]
MAKGLQLLIEKYRYPIMVVLGLLFLTGYFQIYANNAEVQPPKAERGVLDLRSWDFERQGVLSLEGEWEFYWEKLLSPQDLKQYLNAYPYPVERPGGYLSVPGLWNGRSVEQEGKMVNLSGQGFATYRLTILTQTTDQLLGLKLLDFATSYRLWVNGKLVAVNGQVGKTPAETIPQAFPLLVTFAQPTDRIELVLQIANFSHSKGGIWTEMKLGTAGQIQRLREQAVTKNYFFTGGLVIMAVYHLGLYFLRRKDRSPFFCSMLCLLIAIRSATTGETFILNIWPTLNWSALYRLQYLSFYLAIPV